MLTKTQKEEAIGTGVIVIAWLIVVAMTEGGLGL